MADSHSFDEICCVGTSLAELVPIASLCERWLQLTFAVSQLRRNGVPVMAVGGGEQRVFRFSERSFVSPNQSELVKVRSSSSSSSSIETAL